MRYLCSYCGDHGEQITPGSQVMECETCRACWNGRDAEIEGEYYDARLIRKF